MKPNNFSTTFFITLLSILTTTFYAFPPSDEKSIEKLAHKMIQSHYPTNIMRIKLLNHFKRLCTRNKLPRLSVVLLSFQALTCAINTPVFTQAETVLTESYNHFSKTPGFARTVQNLFSSCHYPHSAKGYLYEIETALTLENTHKEKITHFGIQYKTRTFDIQSLGIQNGGIYLTECKNIRWKNKTPHSHKGQQLTKQFLEQQEIASQLDINQTLGTNVTYRIYTKEQVSSRFIRWFNKNTILCETETS